MMPMIRATKVDKDALSLRTTIVAYTLQITGVEKSHNETPSSHRIKGDTEVTL